MVKKGIDITKESHIWYEKAKFRSNHIADLTSFQEGMMRELSIADVMQWVAVKDELPPILETVWLSNGKGWTDLGCRVETNEGWHWAGQNGIIYQEKNQIVAECNSDDLDVMYWHKLPKPPCA